MTNQEIKNLKDGIPNYPFIEVQGPLPPHKYLCFECTGAGCKICEGTGYIIKKKMKKSIKILMNFITFKKMRFVS